MRTPHTVGKIIGVHAGEMFGRRVIGSDNHGYNMTSGLFSSCLRKETLGRRGTLGPWASVFASDKWVDHSPVLPTQPCSGGTTVLSKRRVLLYCHQCVTLRSLFCYRRVLLVLSWMRCVLQTHKLGVEGSLNIPGSLGPRELASYRMTKPKYFYRAN